MSWTEQLVNSPDQFAEWFGVFTVYALNLSDNLDTETECATLDEAMTHLRELVLNELSDPNGPCFERYGLAIDGR